MRDKKKIIGSIAILVIFIIFLSVGYYISKPSKQFNSKEVFNETTSVESKDVKDTKEITVYINGEIKNPGVYKLKNDSRLDELIKISGGFLESADKSKLNLAKKLKDEDYIYVEKKLEGNPNGTANTHIGTSNQDAKININTASKDELKNIPGIGDVTAQKIIDYREKNSRFSSIEDLKKVGRIGDKTLEKIKEKADIR
ncbi:helix-hairpin-helix domain-containing protein [Clostridiaceae bacterium UIB06]|uniref:Helix-hairpin-helix domain-containing protein n=1 Tax=Clostridium thailandense TaxID=2794346 RepID=A0A949WUX4_9CLOT|nr:helix-hairpin-helix domain-containing protein [Clostridium thailandense]MBV7273052.1 helix-hairpin-helix domain-containing protein [Clostridium thailandense]MCH5135716.1 helix-hairpin-helix domain-containing protein [Clostridiaceae bacterium UIB06]